MKGFFLGFEKRAEATKQDVIDVLKKHEERETPEQEAAESEEEQRIEREIGAEKHAKDKEMRFFEGFEKAALQDTRTMEDIATAGSGVFGPLGDRGAYCF